ncbi:MAG: LptF/LptG family permease [Bacteroidales bacterium]|nr:LptF/LptG family permease [Bacteroidales bacterium]
MKIAYRYIIKNFLGPLVLTFFVAIFILLMQFLWKYVDDLVGKGLEIHVLLKFMFYAAGSLMNMALPLAILLASLMTFGNMGERLEVVAMKSAGISISKMMTPLAVLSLCLTVFAFWYADKVIPVANLKLRTLIYSVQEQKPALNIESGVFYNGFENFTIRVGHKKSDNTTIEDVLLYDHSRHQGNVTMTYAQSGTMKMTDDGKFLLFVLRDGYFWDESVNMESRSASKPLSRATFKEQYKRFDLSSFELQESDEEFFSSSQQAMPLAMLSEKIDTLKVQVEQAKSELPNGFLNNLYYFTTFVRDAEEQNPTWTKDSLPPITPQQKQVAFAYARSNAEAVANSAKFASQDVFYRNLSLRSYQVEYHNKFTFSLACLLFFFIGAPLGSIIRKGGIGIPLVITVAFFTFYFMLTAFGKNMATTGQMSAFGGMWLSTLVLIPICIFLTYKAAVDSSVMSVETYEKLFKKIKIKIQSIKKIKK